MAREVQQSSDPIVLPDRTAGLIDTIALQSDFPLEDDDKHSLVESGQWEGFDRPSGRVWKSDGTTRRTMGSITLIRRSDGCRIMCSGYGIRVEVSLPRLFGLCNDEQYYMSQEDVRHGIKYMTEQLLRTTFKSNAGQRPRWHLARIDLAINCDAHMPTIISIYKSARHPRIRADAVVFGDNGIAWYGRDHDLVIYDPRKRPRRGRLGKELKNIIVRDDDPQSCRLEFRYKNKRAIRKLAPHLHPGLTGGLPLSVKRDGVDRVVPHTVDHGVLHRVFSSEVGKLGDGAAVTTISGSSRKPMYRIALRRLAEHDDPSDWQMIREGYRERSIRQIEREVAAIRVQKESVSLVELAWGRTQTSRTDSP